MTRDRLTSIALFTVGVVNFLSVLGFVGIHLLRDMFNMTSEAPEVAVLMQNRAMLFGIIGGLLMVAAFETHMRLTAFLAGGLAMAGYLLLYLVSGLAFNALAGVFLVDLLSFTLLVAALFGHIQAQKEEPVASRY